MALILRLIVNAVALWVATLIVPGISLYETAGDAGIDAGAIDNEVSVPTIAALLIVAVVFTLINAVIDPQAGSESGNIGNLNPQSQLKKKA